MGAYTNHSRTAVFHFVQNVFLKGGFTQTLPTKCYAFRWFFICVRVCEQAHTASTNKNPVTFVTGFVPRTGIEPALPCDNQILSLARLPIPPSGQFKPECSAGCNITLMMEIFQNPIKVFFLVVVGFYLQHCFLGNRIDLIHFHIRLNWCI